MSAEQGEPDDLGHMPSMSSKTRELGELQDMYRRALAASWAAQAGELPADECIDNIFAGGDGWGKDKAGAVMPSAKQMGDSTEDAESEGDPRPVHGHRRTSSAYGGRSSSNSRGHARTGSKENRHSSANGVSGRGSIDQQAQSSNAEIRRRNLRRAHEVDEFEAREDLRSWEISAKV